MKSQTLWDKAKADLTVTSRGGEVGLLVWDHASRVARYAEQIAGLPDARQAEPDVSAVVAAALYHDAAWVDRLRNHEVTWEEVLLEPVSASHREQSATKLQRSGRDFVSSDSLAKAIRAIQTIDDRDSDTIEGRIVAEADRLDEFGVVALWSTIRRGAVHGKGVQSAIDTWRRRKEYRFWDARLKDSFRFDAVRAVAQRRLDQFEELMTQLEAQHLGQDLAEALTPPASSRTKGKSSPIVGHRS